MIEFLVKRPIAVIMSFLAFLLLGMASLNVMPVSLMPEIESKIIQVKIDENNFSSIELENQIVKPLRQQFQQLSNISTIKSKTSDGSSTVILTFTFKSNIDYSIIEVNEKIDQIISDLPKNIKRPKVIKSNPTDIPIFYVNIPYPSEKESTKLEFSRFVENTIKKRLEQLKAIAFVDMTGNIAPEVVIKPNLEKLRRYGISLADIESTIKSNNIQIGNLKIHEGYFEYDVSFNPLISSIKEMKNLQIGGNGILIRLKDVSEIELRQKKERGAFLINGEQGISLAIISKPSSKIRNLKNKVEEKLQLVKAQNSKFNYSISQDQTDLLNYSINSLSNSLLLGGLFAFLVMFLFVRNIKTSIIIGIVIPVSLVISFLFLNLINITINILTLSGLIIGVGLMIDNSIIVVDNISQYKTQGYSLVKSCAKGTYEIIRPLLSSLLTTCSVFIPLIYLSGISGVLFYDQALAIIIGLSISYLVSIFLLPTLYKLFNIKNLKRESTDIVKLYEKSFEIIFKYRKIALVAFILMLIPLFFGVNFLKKEKFPEINYDDFYLNIDWNEEINTEENLTRAKFLSSFIENKEVQTHNYFVGRQKFILQNGNQNSNQLSIYIKTNENSSIDQIKNKVDSLFKEKYSQGIWKFEKPKNLFEQVFIDLDEYLYMKIPEEYHTDIDVIKKDLQNKFSSLDFQEIEKKKSLELGVNLEKLFVYNVQFEDLTNKLRFLFDTREIGKMNNSISYLPIVFQNNFSGNLSLLEKSFVKNKNEVEVPIKELIRIREIQKNKFLYADAGMHYLPLVLKLHKNTNVEALVEYVKENYSDIEISGSYFENTSFLKELIIIITIVLILLYFILAAQFESLKQPFIILLEIPVSLGGAFLFMLFFNISLNIMSMIGIIIMFGIVINDSILKIDTINQIMRNEEISIYNAIHKAGMKRLNAIIMTSLTTILVMIPILFTEGISSDLQRPLAIVVIGGMIIGTFASMYFVPIIYYYFVKNKKTI